MPWEKKGGDPVEAIPIVSFAPHHLARSFEWTEICEHTRAIGCPLQKHEKSIGFPTQKESSKGRIYDRLLLCECGYGCICTLLGSLIEAQILLQT